MLRQLSVLFAGFLMAAAQSEAQQIALTVPAGAPLRVYLNKRLTKRLNEPVEATLIDPLFAFDREVAPAGSKVLGSIVRLDNVSKMERASAILSGDFTPLHRAQVQFTTLRMTSGREVPLQTIETAGLNSIYVANPPKKKAPAGNGGLLGTATQQAKDQIAAKTRSVIDTVRGPDKKERLTEFLLMKLPYHPQWVRKGTRFDPELGSALAFGEAPIQPAALKMLASQPASDSVVHARLITPLNSGTAAQGERVEALLTQPLFSGDRQLILPEGSRVTGAVTMVHKARWFHRGGQLRFNFQNVDLPAGVTLPQFVAERIVVKVPAQLEAAESGNKGNLKVDSEGTVKATESKTRFLAPAVAMLVASRAADNDVSRRTGLPEQNVGGRTVGGGSGFGLLGALAAQGSTTFGKVMGFYGLAWSVYSNIVSRGQEVEFRKNAAVDIKFGAHAPPAGAKPFVASAP